jgi:CDP-diglyceride synthetase
MRWMHTYQASPSSVVVGAVGCVLIGITTLGFIPKNLVSVVFVLWAFAVVIAAIHDLANSPEE